MSEGSRYKKRIYVSAVALGLAIGSVGVAAAATGSGGDQATSTDETAEVQESVYTGSIQAPPADESMSEADEAAQLGGLATITPDEAATSATGAVPGSAGNAELDNENGTVVYSVEVTDDAGTVTDVKVDAGNGAVLDQQVADGDEAGEAAEAGDEAGEAAEADTDDVNDQSGDQNEDQSDNDADEGAEDATEG